MWAKDRPLSILKEETVEIFKAFRLFAEVVDVYSPHLVRAQSGPALGARDAFDLDGQEVGVDVFEDGAFSKVQPGWQRLADVVGTPDDFDNSIMQVGYLIGLIEQAGDSILVLRLAQTAAAFFQETDGLGETEAFDAFP